MPNLEPHCATTTAGDDRGKTPDRAAAPRKASGSAGLIQIFPRSLDAPPPAFRVRRESLLGRANDAPIAIADRRVSRRHAVVVPTDGGFSVKDLGSRHGTFVRGVPVRSDDARVAFGDILRVGETLLLAVSDLEPRACSPRRISAAALGLHDDVIAGPVFCQVLDRAAQVAHLDQPVLVLGESGTGKEIVAKTLHTARRSPGPFVGINISAIPEALFESELFGHERGAFTGAVEARPGAFREATRGVLFLDEVADLRSDLQVKLLRVVDTQRVRPLGARHDVPVDVQVVAATSRDLRAACERSEFRHDLYYRLAGVVLSVPPLRERRDEIVLLALAILRGQAPELRLSIDAAEALANGSWFGNARNLRRVVIHAASAALAQARREVLASDLPDLDPLREDAMDARLGVQAVRLAMARADGVASRAAGLLGVSRSTFYNLCKRFDVPARALRGR